MDSQKNCVVWWERKEKKEEKSLFLLTLSSKYFIPQSEVFLVWFVGFSELAKSEFIKVLWDLILVVTDCSKTINEGFSGSLLCKWCRALGSVHLCGNCFWLAIYTCTHWDYCHSALGASGAAGSYSTASFPLLTLVTPACFPKQEKKLQIPELKLWHFLGVCLLVTSWTFSIAL